MSPVRRRDFRLVVLAIGLSSLGDMIGFIPLALHVHDATGSGLAVSALFIAMWGPIVVAAGLAGRLADRLESRNIVLWASLAQAAVAAVLAFALGSLASVLALTALLGLGTAVVALPSSRSSPSPRARTGSRRLTATWRRPATPG
jgi:predicted MFS family arabinose efflux permease